MKVLHYVPIIGMPIALSEILQSNDPFIVKSQKAALVGATQAALTAISMNTNIFAAKKARTIANIGMTTAKYSTNPLTAVAVAGVTATVAQAELAQTFSKTETAKDPWWIAFVTGLI